MNKGMKMLALVTALLLGAVTLVQATAFSKFDGTDGSFILPPRQAVVYTRYPGNVGGPVEDYSAVVDMAIGQPVVLVYNVYVTSTAQTYPIGVSLSATLADLNVIGVVAFPKGTTSCVAGTTVDVQVKGVALVKVGANVTVGGLLIQSGTAGLLTPSAASAGGAVYTVSGTARVAQVIETKTGIAVTGSLVRARIICP